MNIEKDRLIWIGMFLAVLIIPCYRLQNKNPKSTVYVASGLIREIEPQTRFYIEETSKLDFVVTSTGKSTDQNVFKRLIFIDENKLIYYQFYKIFYFMVFSNTKNSRIKTLIIRKNLVDDAKKREYRPKEKYYKNDLECFLTRTVPYNTLYEVSKSLQALVWNTHTGDFSCIFFENALDQSYNLNIEGVSYNIVVSKTRVENYQITSLIQECTGIFNFANVNSKLLMVLKESDNSFCVDKTQHIIEKLRLEAGNGAESIDETCRKDEKNLFCLKVGKNFMYSIFNTVAANRKMLVMSHKYAQKAKYFDKYPTQNFKIDQSQIWCVNPALYTSPIPLLMGYYNTESDKHCINPEELSNNDGVTLQLNKVKNSMRISGCDISIAKTAENSEFVILNANTQKAICYTKEFSVIEKVYATNFEHHHIFESVEDQICSVDLPLKICYGLKDSIKHMIITNVDNTKNVVLANKDIINPKQLPDFVYDETFHQDDIICFPEKIIKAISDLESKSYYKKTTTNNCIIGALLPNNITLTIGPVSGCNERTFSFISSRLKPKNAIDHDLTQCKPFFEISKDINIVHLINDHELIMKCLKLTCSVMVYSFSYRKSSENSPIAKIKQCTGSNSCINTDPQYFVVYKIFNSLKNINIYVKTKENIFDLIPHDELMIYAPIYYTDDVVCFLNKNIIGSQTQPPFSFISNGYSCVIVRELQTDMKINIKSYKECLKEILFRNSDIKPDKDDSNVLETCSNLYIDNSKIQQYKGENIWNCISYTCGNVNYVIDLSTLKNGVSYSLIICSLNDADSCSSLKTGINIVSISSSRLKAPKIFYNQLEDINLDKNAFYNSFYDVNDFVCFKNDIVVDISLINDKNTYINNKDETMRCIIVKELPKTITLQIRVSTTCQRSVTLLKDPKSIDKKDDLSLVSICSHFIDKTIKKSRILTTHISELKTCITQMCIQKLLILKNDDSVIDCTTNACNLDDHEIKYYKVKSPYNTMDFYIIPQGSKSYPLLDADENTYYNIVYLSSDIVCVKNSLLVDSDKFQEPGVTDYDQDKTCFVIKEMESSKNIKVNMRGSCMKNINLKKASEFSLDEKKLVKEDQDCRSFDSQLFLSTKLNLAFDDLKNCIHLSCFSPEFVILRPQNQESNIALLKECSSGNCLEGLNDFDFLRLISPKKEHIVNVQNIVSRNIITPSTFSFLASYNKDSVVCIEKTKLKTGQFNEENSYELGKHTCIIAAKLDKDTSIKIQHNSKCPQTIVLHPRQSNSLNLIEIGHEQCKEFTDIAISQFTVRWTPRNDLLKCLIHTCSNVISYIKATDSDDPFIYAKSTKCTAESPSYNCITDKMLYNLVEVENPFVSSSFQIRNTEDKQFANFLLNKLILYKPSYYNDDFVCFRKESIQNSSSFLNKKGVLTNDDRMCFLVSNLENSLDVNYNLNSQCLKQIKLIKNSHPQSVETELSPIDKCPDFFKPPDYLKINTYKKDEISKCILDTCSKIESFIGQNHEQEDYTTKDYVTCSSSQGDVACIDGINHLDILKLKSPFMTSSFFVQTIATKPSNLDFYKMYLYEISYFKGEVICFHQNLLVEFEKIVLKHGIFKKNNVFCFIVDELKASESLTVKVHDQCVTTVGMILQHSRPSQPSPTMRDLCKPLYFNDHTPTITMAIDSLKQCLNYTCTKLIYYVINDISGKETKPIKQVQECMADSQNENCISNLQEYLFVKLHRYSHGDDIIVFSGMETHIQDSVFDSFFYEHVYYKNEIPCFKLDRINMDSSLSKHTTSITIKDQKCIFVSELSAEMIIELTDSHSCKRAIHLNPKKRRDTPSLIHQKDKLCDIFHTINDQQAQVNWMTSTNLETCIKHTCSRIIHAVPMPNSIAPLIKSEISQCRDSFKISDCMFSGKTYDFIKITNNYNVKPLLFRTFDYNDSAELVHDKLVYYEPNYYVDDVVCFNLRFVKNKKKFINMEGIYIESQRICIINKELQTETIVHLQITPTCEKSITLDNKKKLTSVQLPPSRSLKDSCQEFLKLDVQKLSYLEYDKDRVMKCVEATCSTIEHFIPLDSSRVEYSVKSLKFCEKDEKAEKCLTNVNFFDAMKVYSPYLERHLYIHSENSQSIDINIYSRYYYLDEYYMNEVVCVPENYLVDKALVKSMDGVFTKHKLFCFVTSEMDDRSSIQLKQFNTCPKIVKFDKLKKRPSTLIPGRSDKCSPFINWKPEIDYLITLEYFRDCLPKTCTKLEYIVQDIPSREKDPVKHLEKCATGLGEIRCVNDVKELQIAKIINPALNMPIFMKFKSSNSIEKGLVERFYYKSRYYNDEIVCVTLSELTNFDEFQFPTLYFYENFKCIIIVELTSTKDLIIRDKHGCTRKIELIHDIPRSRAPSNQEDLDVTCDKLITTKNNEWDVNEITVDLLSKCMKHTCSRIISFMEIPNNHPVIEGKLSRCQNIKAGDSCLDGTKKYDFIKVENDHMTHSIYFRTFDGSSHSSLVKQSLSYYNPYYFNDDVVCFHKSHLEKSSQIERVSGTFEDRDRYCVISKELRGSLVLTQKLSPQCSQDIEFYVEENHQKMSERDELQSKCKIFFKPEMYNGRMSLITKKDLVICVKKTCATVQKYANFDDPKQSSIVTTIRYCPDSTNQHSCLENISSFDFLKISSPFLTSPIYVQSSDISLIKLEQFSKHYYLDEYYSDEYFCVHEDLLIESGEISMIPGIFKKESTFCFAPGELSKTLSVKIKQFGICEKNVILNPTLTRNQVELQRQTDICSLFYNKHDVSKDKLDLETLKQCVAKTCTRVEYFVSSSDHRENPIRKLHTCNDQHGSIQCLRDIKEYNLIKLVNPIMVAYELGQSGFEDNLDTQILQRFHYEYEYYSDEVVCINADSISNRHILNPKSYYLINHVLCLIVKEVDNTVKTILIANSKKCIRAVNLIPDRIRPSGSHKHEQDTLCQIFVRSIPQNPPKVEFLNHDTLISCLQHTCSSLISFMEMPTNTILFQSTLKSCKKTDHFNICLNPHIKYDFIKVENDYRPTAFHLRTYDSSDITGYPSERPQLYKFHYYFNDVVCFNANIIKSSLATVQPENGKYKDDQRVCFVIEDGFQELHLDLRVAGDCHQKITLKSETDPEDRDQSEVIKSRCSHFLEVIDNGPTLPIYSKQELSFCISSTCSTIKKFIQLTQSSKEYTHKEMHSCSTEPGSLNCLATVTEFESLEVYSHYTKTNFYVRSSESSSSNSNEFYLKQFYQDTFYENEVLCIANDMLIGRSFLESSKQYFTKQSAICIIINELSMDTSVLVKMFDKCQKTLTLVKKKSSDSKIPRVLHSNCQSFISGKQNILTGITKNDLSKCLKMTCSKLEYVVHDSSDANKPIKVKTDCNTDNGIDDCLRDVVKFYFSKVTNPSLSQPLFIVSDSRVSLYEGLWSKFYYETNYYNNDVVCMKSDRITEPLQFDSVVSFESQNLKCVVIAELSKEIVIKLKSSSRCMRKLIFIPSQSRNENTKLHLLDTQCHDFYVQKVDVTKILELSLDQFSECVKHTCARVLKGVKIDRKQHPLLHSQMTVCSHGQNENTCLVLSNMYDFMTVQTDYVNRLLQFRNYIFDLETNYVSKKIVYYQRNYFKDDVVCFNKSHIKIKIDEEKGVGIYVENQRICVIPHERSKNLVIEHILTPTCQKDLVFHAIKTESQLKENMEIESHCGDFIKHPNYKDNFPLVNKPDLIFCAEALCLMVTLFIKTDHNEKNKHKTREIKSCQSDISVDECLRGTEYYDALEVITPYRDAPLFIHSSYNKGAHLIMSSYFHENYYSDEVLCIHKDPDVTDLSKFPKDAVLSGQLLSCIDISKLHKNEKVSVKQHGKCLKEINLVFNTKSSDASMEYLNECVELYIETTNTFEFMSKDKLANCIVKTCSKIEYFVQRIDKFNEIPISQIVFCSEPNGVSTCITNTEFFFVKITNDLLTSHVFIVSDIFKNYSPNYDKFFYKSQYHNNDVVCFKETSIVEKDFYAKNSIKFGNIECVSIYELSSERTVHLKSKSQCARIIKLNPIVNSGEKHAMDMKCHELIEETTNPKMVKYMSTQDLKICSSHTCSRMVEMVETPLQNSQILSAKLITCDLDDSENECIRSDRLYDFVKIENDYIEKPILFRTYKSTEMPSYLPKNDAILYKSTYFMDDVACFYKERIEGVNDYLEKKGIFHEDQRVCAIVKDLEETTVIRFLLTSSCSYQITFSKEARIEGYVDKSDMINTNCHDFLNVPTPSVYLPIYTKSELLKCLSDTCSTVKSFVVTSIASPDYIYGKLKECPENETSGKCLESIQDFDALEISTPFGAADNTFYVRSKDYKDSDNNIYTTTFLNDSYFKNEVLCIHKTYIQNLERKIPEKSLYKKGNAYCIVVNQLKNDVNLKILQYGICERTIKLLPKTLAVSNVKAEDNCKNLYNFVASEAQLIYTLEDLEKCIKRTCLKLEYVVSKNIGSSSVHQEAKICNSNYGDSNCLDNLSFYFYAKLLSKSFNHPIYVVNQPIVNMKIDIFKSHFYKLKYYTYEMVCFHNQMVTPKYTIDSLLNPIFSAINYFCLVVHDLDKDVILEVNLMDECTKSVHLVRKTNRRYMEEEEEDERCIKFYTDLNDIVGIQKFSLNGVRFCVKHTCSKVVAYVERQTPDVGIYDAYHKLCTSGYGEDSCLQSFDHYDMVEIKSIYNPYNLLLRTFDIFDIDESRKISIQKTFSKSIYFSTEIVCFLSRQIVNFVKIPLSKGIYHDSIRTCFVLSQMTQNLNIGLKATEECNHIIHLIPSMPPNSNHEAAAKDLQCSFFYKNKYLNSNLDVFSKQDFSSCVAHTCSKFSFIDDNVLKSSKCADEIEGQCENRMSYNYASVLSLYLEQVIYTISEEAKNYWLAMFQIPAMYRLYYDPGAIVCFKNELILNIKLPSYRFFNADHSIFCYSVHSTDDEFILSSNFKSQDQFGLVKSWDRSGLIYTNKKSFNVSIYSYNIKFSKIEIAFSALSDFNLNEDIDNLNDVKRMKRCFGPSNKETYRTKSHFSSVVEIDGYTFSISRNIIFPNNFMLFHMRKKKACFGFCNIDLHSLPTSNSSSVGSDINLHQMECLFVADDRMTIHLNARYNHETINQSLNGTCLESKVIENCNHTVNYTDFITVCYRIEWISNQKKSNPSSSQRLLFIDIFQNDGSCFVKKITVTNIATLCKIEESQLFISIFDWNIALKDQYRYAIIIPFGLWQLMSIIFVIVVGVIIYYYSPKQRSHSKPPLHIIIKNKSDPEIGSQLYVSF